MCSVRFSLRCAIAVLVVLLSLCGCTHNQKPNDAADFSYELTDEGVVITGYSGQRDNVIIPDEIEGHSVTAIGDSAFYMCDTQITSVKIPDTVVQICRGAFMQCDGLKSISLPESLAVIEERAFFGCELLDDVALPSELAEIGDNAFEGCAGLDTILIPQSVTKIGRKAFSDCDRLTAIEVDSQNNCYADIDGVLFDKEITKLLRFPQSHSAQSYAFPDTVTEIAVEAFGDCGNLREVSLGENITIIGNAAFFGCGVIESIYIPQSVEHIGETAFARCYSLRNICVSEDNASYCSIDDVLFDKNLTILHQYPTGKTEKKCIVPDGVEDIAKLAFGANAALEEIILPDSVQTVREFAFDGCTALTDIVLPDGITGIDMWTFSECKSLAEITIPNGVTAIGWFAFSNCESLTKVHIPESVTYIDALAFNNCSPVIYAPEGSYAIEYAVENGFDYLIM